MTIGLHSIFNTCTQFQILFVERLQFVHRMSAPGERAVPESHGMGAYVSAQYCSFRQILQRPYHNGIRNRNLGSGSIGGQTFGTPRGITWTKGLIFSFLKKHKSDSLKSILVCSFICNIIFRNKIKHAETFI